jgi:Uncharacterized FAD-dependent dehydrogenases
VSNKNRRFLKVICSYFLTVFRIDFFRFLVYYVREVNMKTQILIIGAGPSGIFTAFELIRKNARKEITVVERGLPVEKRICSKQRTGHCVGCKNCSITTGFSGAGAFSDGKLSLSSDVGGDLPELVGHSLVQNTIDYVDGIYLEFGATTKVEGVTELDKIKDVRRKAICAGLKLVDCPIRHLGTEKAQELYFSIEQYLLQNGVNILFDTSCEDIITENGVCRGAVVRRGEETYEITADKTVVATGRVGADWLEKICEKHSVSHKPGTVDIGVRVEVRNEVMEEINEILYESKLIGYPNPFKNKVRTFCQNPGGFVSQENYDNNLAIVNGHSYKDRKSDNTNLSILCSHNFTEPFNQPIEYARKVGELTNMLASGKLLVQRYGDILDGKRTWQNELGRSNLKPTLKDAVAGDITAAMPYRTMISILNFIKQVNEVVPGFAGNETLLYSPEIKFYSNKIKLDKKLNTDVENLYCLGDSSGWTRGLMMASVMGVLAATYIMEN